jgi:hypothetical protein
MLLELSRTISFFLSLLSLYPVLMSAFFIPGIRWEERLTMALLKVALAGCICFASGLLFCWPSGNNTEATSPEGTSAEATEPLMSTLPVRMFCWTMAGVAILFTVSWYLEEYYVPLVRHGCCRP